MIILGDFFCIFGAKVLCFPLVFHNQAQNKNVFNIHGQKKIENTSFWLCHFSILRAPRVLNTENTVGQSSNTTELLGVHKKVS